MTNPSEYSETNYWTLYAGSSGSWTQLGQGSVLIDAGRLGYVQLSFSTNSYVFGSGQRVRLEATGLSLTDIYWDGTRNDSTLSSRLSR